MFQFSSLSTWLSCKAILLLLLWKLSENTDMRYCSRLYLRRTFNWWILEEEDGCNCWGAEWGEGPCILLPLLNVCCPGFPRSFKFDPLNVTADAILNKFDLFCRNNLLHPVPSPWCRNNPRIFLRFRLYYCTMFVRWLCWELIILCNSKKLELISRGFQD